jgi:hypothetical protein
MDELTTLEWIWHNITDEALAAAFKPRMIFFGSIGVLISIIVKHTKTKIDDEFIAALKQRFNWGDDQPK